MFENSRKAAASRFQKRVFVTANTATKFAFHLA
jgi:hypothetical protein